MQKTYNSACDFWRDLKLQFGADAKIAAFAYLDTITAQERLTGMTDPEELLFCCELFALCSA